MSTTDDVRRLRVAALHLRGLSPVEIRAALQQGNIPGDLETVCADIAFLEAIWTTEVRLEQEKRQARLLAELREARRAAWAAGKLDLVLKSIEQETKLLEEPTPPPSVEMLHLG